MKPVKVPALERAVRSLAWWFQGLPLPPPLLESAKVEDMAREKRRDGMVWRWWGYVVTARSDGGV